MSTSTNKKSKKTTNDCFHCGEHCINEDIFFEEKHFCCNGCKNVYQLLTKSNLDAFYSLNQNAGVKSNDQLRKDRYKYLEDPEIIEQLVDFKDEKRLHITLSLPTIHCSSCLYLLEHSHKLNDGIIRTEVNFTKKKAHFIINTAAISLRELVDLLSNIGYEPYISLKNAEKGEPAKDRSLVYRIGVAGFCFGNIMLLSFPDYFSGFLPSEQILEMTFRYLSVALSIPVLFYSASIFIKSAWKSLINQRHLNIDAPVAIVILVTFIRSLVEIFIFEKGGYLESMTGVTFFMLAGRFLQNKTYDSLSFKRDFTDYFPLAATLLEKGQEVTKHIYKLKVGDVILVHNNELIPADGVLEEGDAKIDYSFVTGESQLKDVAVGSTLYAGGRQQGALIRMKVTKAVKESYLTDLWSQLDEKKGKTKRTTDTPLNKIAHYFTLIVLTIALIGGAVWYAIDATKVFEIITSTLIVACPCGLLLSSFFTKGFMMRILEKNGIFLKNAQVIEKIKQINHYVFDKTGTLTAQDKIDVQYIGLNLKDSEKDMIHSLAQSTTHPLSNPIKLLLKRARQLKVQDFNEAPGLGVSGIIDNTSIKVGTVKFIPFEPALSATGTALVVSIDEEIKGYFELKQGVRDGMQKVISELNRHHIKCSLLSGDEPYQKGYFETTFGNQLSLNFQMGPTDKLNYIEQLKDEEQYVAMIGDGLNDAGALGISDVGIAVTENTNNFTPAADAILIGGQLSILDKIVKYAKSEDNIIHTSLFFSACYNFIGLVLSLLGFVTPLLAAILMPASTLTIVLITYFMSRSFGKSKRLSIH